MKATVKELHPEADNRVIEHFEQLALFYVFEQDPDAEELEKEKLIVQEESRNAQIENAQKMAEDERKLREEERQKGVFHSSDEE